MDDVDEDLTKLAIRAALDQDGFYEETIDPKLDDGRVDQLLAIADELRLRSARADIGFGVVQVTLSRASG